MNFSLYNPIQSRPLPVYESFGVNFVSPFKVSMSGTTASINTYSSLLPSFAAKDTINIFGLDMSFEIPFGTKLYLENYYDADLNPYGARIRNDNRWKDLTNVITTSEGTSNVNVYPGELDIIQISDLGERQTQMEEDLQSSSEEVSQATTNITDEISTGNLDSGIGAELISSMNINLALYQEEISTNLNQLHSMMAGNFVTKKLFRGYKLIAYTTHDMSSNLGGSFVYPSDGTRPYQIVQCLNNDLMLVTDCYNGVPIKVAIPWVRPVYLFEDEE